MIRKLMISAMLLGMIGYTFYSAFEKKQAQKQNEQRQAEIIETATAHGLDKGKQAPAFSLVDINNKSVTLDQYKGKTVILNFWATWCPPCKKEIPDFVAFANEKVANVEVVSINLTHSEKTDLNGIHTFLKEMNIQYPVLLDKQGKVTELYKVITIPTTYIIDSQGIIQKRHLGPMSVEDLKEAVKKIK